VKSVAEVLGFPVKNGGTDFVFSVDSFVKSWQAKWQLESYNEFNSRAQVQERLVRAHSERM
jgi:hypothetical protein